MFQEFPAITSTPDQRIANLEQSSIGYQHLQTDRIIEMRGESSRWETGTDPYQGGENTRQSQSQLTKGILKKPIQEQMSPFASVDKTQNKA